jgi:multicomponent Na+:H+ antiporter subunit D
VRSLIVALLVPFGTALATAMLNGKPRAERAVAITSTLCLTAWALALLRDVDANGVQATVVGGWSAPWGISLVADRLSAMMLALSTMVGSVVAIYSVWTVTERQQRYFFYPLMQLTLLGVNWAFVTGDLFNLFVAYEVMLVASYGMMMVGASKAQVRQTFKYIGVNAIGSTLFVVACGVVYATIGTLNMAEIAARTAALGPERAAVVTAGSMLLLVVFALKSAAFPLIYWLPDSYPVVPLGVNGYFAGLLTKVGVYSLLRAFVMLFRQDGAALALDVLLVLSALTMFLGVLGAACQWEIRRILSWHIISQVGYMLMGIGLAAHSDSRIAALAVTGTILHVAHNVVVKSSLFLVGGIAERITGSQELERNGGIVSLAPGVAAIFLVPALSIAGIPPLSGFVSKFVLVRAGLEAGANVVVAVAVATSFLTLYSMTKIWVYVFWGDAPVASPAGRYRPLMVPVSVLVAATIAMGLFGQGFVALSERAAASLCDPREYVAAVLGDAAAGATDRLAKVP